MKTLGAVRMDLPWSIYFAQSDILILQQNPLPTERSEITERGNCRQISSYKIHDDKVLTTYMVYPVVNKF